MTDTPYPPALGDLVVHRPVQPLGPGHPHTERKAALAALSIPAAFAPHEVRDRAMAQACLAGLWLGYDFLDESHAISQDLSIIEGSYWHALMHRREPDYGNSKYWLRRVGRHAIFSDLARQAAELARRSGVAESDYLAGQSTWDAFAFVDLCERASHGPAALETLCREIQTCEWDLLFAFCLRAAVS
jgi:hypothetical protein